MSDLTPALQVYAATVLAAIAWKTVKQEEIPRWLMTYRQNWPGSKQKTRD